MIKHTVERKKLNQMNFEDVSIEIIDDENNRNNEIDDKIEIELICELLIKLNID